MNDFLNKNKIKLSILALSVVMLITSASYAWFSATVSGNPTNNNVVTSGVMEITYVDGQLIGTPTNFLPGQEIVKYFTVRNTGNVDTEYVIYLSEVINTFNPTTDLEYKLEKLSTNGYEKAFTVCPTIPTAINNVAISLDDKDTHEYKLTIKFKETNANQDTNQGKKFQARLSINEYNRAPITITYNGNGGTPSIASESMLSGDAILELPTVTRADDNDYYYTFNNWYDAPTGGNVVSVGDTFVDDTTVYAHWYKRAIACTIHKTVDDSRFSAYYSCNRGSGTMTECAVDDQICPGGQYGYANRLYLCLNGGGEPYTYCDRSMTAYTVYGAQFQQNISCECPLVEE